MWFFEVNRRSCTTLHIRGWWFRVGVTVLIFMSLRNRQPRELYRWIIVMPCHAMPCHAIPYHAMLCGGLWRWRTYFLPCGCEPCYLHISRCHGSFLRVGWSLTLVLSLYLSAIYTLIFVLGVCMWLHNGLDDKWVPWRFNVQLDTVSLVHMRMIMGWMRIVW